MVTISVCMIVKNEETVLGRCLDCAKQFADEIIVIDTGSTDRTREIARRYTEKVSDFAWTDDFAAARNASFAMASMDYCMWLDADDLIEDAEIERINALKETLAPDTDVVMMRYHTAFDASGHPVFTYYRERLLRRAAGFRWEGEVHEAITPSGKIVYSEIAISHKKASPGDPDRNLKIFENLLKKGKSLLPRQQFYYARELYYHSRFREAAEEFLRFLEDGNGWIENNIEACRQLAYCYYGMGEERKALLALFRSFVYDRPRAEVLCDIGSHLMTLGRYREAIYWYQQAAACERNDRSGAFVLADCYDYIPYLQLCVCYDRLDERDKAAHYNELAGNCKPSSVEVQINRRYFAEQNTPGA